MDDPALTITQDLDLDVPRPIEVPLEINLAAAEERARLALRDWQHPGKLGGVTGYFYAAYPAARACPDQHRLADRSSRPPRRPRDRGRHQVSLAPSECRAGVRLFLPRLCFPSSGCDRPRGR